MKTKKTKKDVISIKDLTAEDMQYELIIMSDKDRIKDEFDPKYEEGIVSKRGQNDAKVVKLSSSVMPAKFAPIYLTKLGHGYYYEETMSMRRFTDCKDSDLVGKVTEALIKYPSIQRINLYACKSGLTPQELDKKPLAQRVNAEEDTKLSYCENFALQLIHSFQKNNKELPKNLSIVGALGDTKSCNGKISVSGNKRSICQEIYTQVDTKTGFIKFDVNKFAQSYKSAITIESNPTEGLKKFGLLRNVSNQKNTTTRSSSFSYLTS